MEKVSLICVAISFVSSLIMAVKINKQRKVINYKDGQIANLENENQKVLTKLIALTYRGGNDKREIVTDNPTEWAQPQNPNYPKGTIGVDLDSASTFEKTKYRKVVDNMDKKGYREAINDAIGDSIRQVEEYKQKIKNKTKSFLSTLESKVITERNGIAYFIENTKCFGIRRFDIDFVDQSEITVYFGKGIDKYLIVYDSKKLLYWLVDGKDTTNRVSVTEEFFNDPENADLKIVEMLKQSQKPKTNTKIKL